MKTYQHSTSIKHHVSTTGFAIARNVFGKSHIQALQRAFAEACNSTFVRQQNGSIFAARNVLQTSPEIYGLASTPPLLTIAQEVIGERAFPVRCILFDKTAAANWKVAWHQDLTIAVQEKKEVEGYGPWSIKDGIPHVQPPNHILESMITLRVHLDSCAAANGALKVIPKSNHLGKLCHADITNHVQQQSAATCEASLGDVLVMRPLLLHSSPTAINPERRRVVHIEYAATDLEKGLDWYRALDRD